MNYPTGQAVYLVGHDDGSFSHKDKGLLVLGQTVGRHSRLQIEKILMVFDDSDDFRPIAKVMGLTEGVNFHYYEL